MWWHHCCHSNLGHLQENVSAPLTESLSSSFFSFLLLPPYFLVLACDQELLIYFQLFTVITCLFPFIVVRMDSTPNQCSGMAGEVCSHFLPAKDKNSHKLCINCHGKCCTADDCCEDYHDWAGIKWDKVSACHEKSPIQWEKKKRKAKSSSSFAGFSSPSVMTRKYCKMEFE